MVIESLRRHTTASQRRRFALARVQLRQPTSWARRLPDFLVIGAQRAGTSSLYRHLSAQPGVVKPLRKEVDYFSAAFDRPMSWYRAHFPVRRPGIQTFEATPQYLVHPLAPTRVRSALPDAKLVVFLRDPIARLRSQHAHMRALGLEDRSLVGALEAEQDRIAEDLARIELDHGHDPKALFRYGYLARSLYGEQLERWRAAFPEPQFHIGSFENLIADPSDELSRLHRFLGLPAPSIRTLGNASRPNAPADPSDVPDFVRHAIAEDRQLLVDILDREPAWPHIARP